MHSTSDVVIAISGVIAALAAIISPIIFRSDVKRSMAETWGAVKATVDSHGDRLDKVEADVKDHGDRISYMEGKANGQAARAH